MKHHKITLSKGQYLSDIEPFKTGGIPTNSIIHKVLTGCGATTLEIKFSKRNSIIIVPNVPVIIDKVKKHNGEHSKDEHILGVYKEITDVDIDDYLESSVKYKKILTTPEGFITKVLRVFSNDLEQLFKNYFILFDECERVITDVSYRDKIAAPFEEFFKFDNKALVSATTLPFSHKEFENFEHYVVEPDYNFAKPITVINTNNVIESLERHLKTLGDNKQFLFVNSTNVIFDIVDIVKTIRSGSKAYCASKSVAKLRGKKFFDGSDKLNLDDIGNYNFLTSRYFSALDIELNYKPDIILVTDVVNAEQSILDPHTEIIQIAGRFRNGINSLTHITNFDSSIEALSGEEAKHYLNGRLSAYEHIVDLLSKSKNAGYRKTLMYCVQNCPEALFYFGNSRLNDFMVDNYYHEERVRGYYKDYENLKAAYASVAHHFTPTYKNEEYHLSDKDRHDRSFKSSKKAEQREVIRQIDKLTMKPGGPLVLHNSYSLLNNLRSLFPKITEGYDLLGKDGLEKTNYVTSKVKKATKRMKDIKALKALSVRVYNVYEEGSEHLDENINKVMPGLCSLTNYPMKTGVSTLNKLFQCSRTTRQKQHYTILNKKIDLDGLLAFD